MAQIDLKEIAKLRICVGFLGESQQYSWWKSNFISTSSAAFLMPIFAKTAFLSQYYGVKKSATIVHDEHIGIGKGIFHLFRLPERHEIELHKILESGIITENIKALINTKENAENFLQESCIKSNNSGAGPVRMGAASDIMKKNIWNRLAYHYLNAFNGQDKTFPFFSETT